MAEKFFYIESNNVPSAKLYPGYDLALKVTCQIVPWVWFGEGHRLAATPDPDRGVGINPTYLHKNAFFMHIFRIFSVTSIQISNVRPHIDPGSWIHHCFFQRDMKINAIKVCQLRFIFTQCVKCHLRFHR